MRPLLLALLLAACAPLPVRYVARCRGPYCAPCSLRGDDPKLPACADVKRAWAEATDVEVAAPEGALTAADMAAPAGPSACWPVPRSVCR